jgi:DNA-binding SARP family transcriptional activator
MRADEAAPILPIQFLLCEHGMHRMTGPSGEASDAGAGLYAFDLIVAFRLRAPDGGDLTPPGRDHAFDEWLAIERSRFEDRQAAQLAMTASHACGQRDAIRRVHHQLEATLRRDLGRHPRRKPLAISTGC